MPRSRAKGAWGRWIHLSARDRNELDPAALELSGEDAFHFFRTDTRNWDLLVLDPPPFARERGSVERAARAYKDLHLWSFCRAGRGSAVAGAGGTQGA